MSKLEEAQRLIDSIKNENVREYYQYVLGPEEFFEVYKKFGDRGFVFDPNSGLMFRDLFSKKVQGEIECTLVEGVFPRPVDLHYHKDVDEYLLVLEGEGTLVFTTKDGTVKEGIELKEGTEVKIPVGTPHSFIPDGEYLLIRLACKGLLDPQKEVTLSPFSDYWSWGLFRE